ncbi:MAG: AAA family ATPase [Paludisphaera borealis]|uniref:ExeA family protein n=1 Tax=Paludisphaera borealis TaxID=1387353 RepID=UPI002840183E|nr:AAA family ATPase [Paludisphaera borealis]MDR3619633.1 AAA family ATPase [Paludisphaera borealis]
MYEEHYGLEHRPFGETVSPASYVALPTRDAASRRLRYGLEHGLGPALLYGPSGSGKTLLTRRLALEMGVPTVHLTFPAMPAVDLLTLLAEGLGASVLEVPTMSAVLRRLREALSDHTSRGVRPLLIVDEAQAIHEPAAFEVLRLLLNFNTHGTPDLSLLLAGTAELLLQAPAALLDRLTARSLLAPLTETESATYIEGRLSAAGAREPLFAPDALADLHLAALGVPRRLNHLADLSLLIAYAESRPQVDPRIVAIAAREFHCDPLAA